MLVDVYTVYSEISCNSQIINLMPFDRMDRFDKCLASYSLMLKHIDVEDCPCSMLFDYETFELQEDWSEKEIKEVCYWKTYHADVREMKKSGTYRNVVIGCLVEDGSRTRVGSVTEARNRLLDINTVVRTVNTRALDVTTFLYDGLKSRVYTDQDRILINHIRRLLDMKTLICNVQTNGAATVSTLKWRSFRESAVFIENSILTRVSEEELRLQYKEFVRRVESLGPDMANRENTEIFGKFLDPKLELYK